MPTPNVVLYTKFGCGFCFRAKRLLDQKGVDYAEHDITMGGPRREEMLERGEFVRTAHVRLADEDLRHRTCIGGALEREGKLDALLAG